MATLYPVDNLCGLKELLRYVTPPDGPRFTSGSYKRCDVQLIK